MILWIIIFVMIVSFIVGGIVYSKFYEHDTVYLVSFAIGIVSACALISLLIALLINYIDAPIIQVEKQETYKSLVYKAETEAIRDDFGIMNKEYIDEVQEWNENLAKMQAEQRNFWIGIFIPNIYDDFEYIDLNTIVMKED